MKWLSFDVELVEDIQDFGCVSDVGYSCFKLDVMHGMENC
jgi:hypothetical protein